MTKIKSLIALCFVAFALVLPGCDPHKPPKLVFKTDTGYTSSDATVSAGTTIKVGIIADKTEDELKRYNISYSFDGTTSTTTKESFNLTASEEKHYEKDYEFTVRNQAGVEKWYFTVTDKDGNIAQLTLNLTVN